jgi:D-psicose/D-tagatose/L-ribulose 3-epimerase
MKLESTVMPTHLPRQRKALGPTTLSKLPKLAAFAFAFAVAAVRPAPVAFAAPAAKPLPIGLCTMEIDKAKAAGFDYAELGVKTFTSMSDEDWAKFQAKHKEIGLPTPVANNFIPAELKVVGPEVDEAKILDYVKKALDRSKQLGIKIIVFGSGGSRKVPDGFSKDEAHKQLVTIAKKIAPEAKKRGIVIAVEPLQSNETNIINSAAEGLEWVKAVGHPNFALMVDFYHLSLEKEDPAILVKAANQIKHFHIANPHGRAWPLSSEEFDYSGFFENMRKSHYRGRISVEGKTSKFDEEAPKTIAFLREATVSGPKPPSDPSVNVVTRPAPGGAAKAAGTTPSDTVPSAPPNGAAPAKAVAPAKPATPSPAPAVPAK